MLHSARSASQGRVSLSRAAGRFKTPLRVREAGRARCWAARGCVLALLRARRARAVRAGSGLGLPPGKHRPAKKGVDNRQ